MEPVYGRGRGRGMDMGRGSGRGRGRAMQMDRGRGMGRGTGRGRGRGQPPGKYVGWGRGGWRKGSLGRPDPQYEPVAVDDVDPMEPIRDPMAEPNQPIDVDPMEPNSDPMAEPIKNGKSKCPKKPCAICCGVLAFILTVFAILIIIFFPTMPTVYDCTGNDEFWGQLEGKKKKQLAVANANLMSIELKDLDVSVWYNGYKIAWIDEGGTQNGEETTDLTFKFEQLTITDTRIEVVLDPAPMDLPGIQRKYADGTLEIEIVAKATVNAAVIGIPVLQDYQLDMKKTLTVGKGEGNKDKPATEGCLCPN